MLGLSAYLLAPEGHDQDTSADQGIQRGVESAVWGEEMTPDELQRLTRLEVQFEHLEEKLDDTHAKVTAMHDIITQAKGAKWVIVGTAAISSAIMAGVIKAMPFLGSWPK